MKYFIYYIIDNFFIEMLNSSILRRGFDDCNNDQFYRRHVPSPEGQRELVHLYFDGNVLKMLIYFV